MQQQMMSTKWPVLKLLPETSLCQKNSILVKVMHRNSKRQCTLKPLRVEIKYAKRRRNDGKGVREVVSPFFIKCLSYCTQRKTCSVSMTPPPLHTKYFIMFPLFPSLAVPWRHSFPCCLKKVFCFPSQKPHIIRLQGGMCAPFFLAPPKSVHLL